jgi:hypothetical protein
MCSWRSSMLQKYLGTLPQICTHDAILSRSTTDNSFDLMAWFLLCHALSTVGPYIDKCVSFLILSNQFNLPQMDSNQVVEIPQRLSMETRMHLSSISSLISKGLNTYVNKGISVVIHLPKCLKNFFSFVIMGYFVYFYLIHFRIRL